MTGGNIGSSSAPLTAITNYLPISDRLGTGGQPTAEQFALIREAGYQVVINLAMPTSTNALPNEGELVTRQRMTFIHIPVQWESPRLDDFLRFQSMLDTFENEKVFVHCALNMRASCFLFLYRIIRQKVSLEQARKDLAIIWQPNEIWQQFMIDVLNKYNLGIGAF